MTELVDLLSAHRLTKTKQAIKPVLIFLVSTVLSLASWISVQGWKYGYVGFLGVRLQDNSWKRALFQVVEESFVLLSTLFYFKSYFPGDDVEGVGGLGFLFGYFILPKYPNVFGVNVNREKVLPVVVLVWALWRIFVSAWALWMVLQTYYWKDLNRRGRVA